MRVVVCVLLLSGLLAGLTEGYSVQRTPEWRVAPQTVQYQPWSSKQDDNSEQDDQSFIASEETEEDKLWTFDEDPDWTPLESQESHENDGSFIASEETEEGELWSSDEDPDWTPSESQENEGEEDYSQEDYYSQEDDYTHEDYSQEDDYTHEDYSQEDDYTQEDYSQEGDYTHEVSSQEDDYTQEVYSQEDDYSQEHHSQEDDYNQIPDDQPFPDVFVPGDHGVNAEFWQGGKGLQHLHDDWPQLQDQDQDYSRRKRDVKGRYQTGSQVVQVPGVYGSEQDTLDSGLWGGIQEGDGGRPGVSTGVEPLLPVGGPSQHDVGEGVEPEGVTSDKDEESRGSSVGDWFREGWRSFTGTVEDIGDKVIDVAGDVTGGVHDLIHHTYHGVRDKVSQLVDRFKVLIRKFGILVQEGVLYCLRRFEHAVDQVQESTVFEKLEKELENGHAEVTKFFQILGEKVQAWNEQHRSENIDAGLIGGHTQQGQSHQEIDNMPDFLQDQQVQDQLNKLADVGVLTQQDIIILTEEHLHQDQQNQQQNPQNQQQNQDQQQGQQNYQQQDQYNQDGWPQLQDQDQDYSRRRRYVKRSYQTGSQVVQVPGVYGSEQDTLDSGLWGGIQEGDGGRPGVSTGVEPLLPVGGPSQHDVGEGVEPEGVTSDKDEESRGSSVGDWFREGWRSFTGTVEDIGDKVIDVAGDVTGGVRDLIHHTYHGVRDKVSQLVDRFKVLIRKFGILVQEGVLYCLRRFERAVDQVQESTVFEKLEKELENGHAEVTKFFQILGEKVQAWNEQHRSENIDAGLIGGHTQQGQSHQEIDNMPDFLQDQQVQVQLNKLADVGVLTQQDIIILTEEHLHQDQQNQQQNQQEHQQDQQQNQNYDSQQQNQQQGQRNYQQQDQYNPKPKFIQFPE